MKKKQYIVPSVESYKYLSEYVLWGSGGSGMPEPAPQRIGDGPSVKLTKMYI